ncbi:MAG: RHS repeat-associated core domain-containing protein, partial [Lachnoclostridium sp.]|nr:RHS repeat-associated core domain-containing protein [Lachnoclostridium sp.]
DKQRLTKVTANKGSSQNNTTNRTYQYDDTTTDVGNITTWTIDAKGNKSAEVANGAGQIIKTFDVKGSVKETTEYQYDVYGNLETQIQPNGDRLEFTYDNRSRLRKKEAFYANDTKCKYYTKYDYDSSDRLTNMQDYDYSNGRSYPTWREEITYDKRGRRTSFAAAPNISEEDREALENSKIQYTYNDLNQLRTITYAKQKGLQKKIFTYDGNGNIHLIQGDIAGIGRKTLREYEYNDNGDVGKMTDSLEYLSGGDRKLVKEYDYDQFQRVKEMTYADSTISSNNNPQIQESFTYQYDKQSQIIKEVHENKWADDAAEQMTRETNYEYDRLNRLKKSTEESQKGTQPVVTKQSSYQYDTVGNLTRKEEGTEVTTYTYNSRNQMTQEVNADETMNYVYDANGNQTRMRYGDNTQDGIDYYYDIENRMTGTGKFEVGKKTYYTQNNRYNSNGQRIYQNAYIEIEKDGSTQYESEVAYYFYEDSSLLYAISGDIGVGPEELMSGMESADIFYLSGTNDNVMMAEEHTGITEVAGIEEIEAYGYTKDVRGSSMELMDSDGEVAVSYQYSDYGETTIKETDSIMPPKNERMYAGKIYDEETGNYYNTARFYWPEAARFLTQDSYRGEQEEFDTWNLYTYCAGNPINYTDPTGHWHGKDHLKFTKKVIGRLEIKNKAQKKALKKGCTFPDKDRKKRGKKSKYANGKWHGGIGFEKMKTEQLEKAVRLWNKSKTKAYREIGNTLHSVQDYYAHRIKLEGNYVRIKSVNPPYVHKDYWSDEFEGKYKSTKRTRHYLTADNPKAKMKGGEWILVKRSNNPRVKNAIDATEEYIREFQSEVGIR